MAARIIKPKIESTFDPILTGEVSKASRLRPNPYRELLDSRRGRSSNELPNIQCLELPFKSSNGVFSINQQIELCRKTYYGFALARNVIDVMSEFANGEIYLTGGSVKSKEFINQWLKKVQVWNLTDQFFREYFKGGNVFFIRFDGLIKDEGMSNYSRLFSGSKIPLRYLLLDAIDIRVQDEFITDKKIPYYRILKGYEIMKLRNPKTPEDAAIYKDLPPNIKANIKNSSIREILFPLDPDRLYSVFYKKPDYEPFGVPFLWAVLKDIDWKLELKKMDRQMNSQLEKSVLLVTMGDKDIPASPEKIRLVDELFANPTVNRVLVADWTTKAQFVMPDLAALLGPEKYEEVDKDINVGLNNVFFSGGDGEKFANTNIKVQVFVERLNEARHNFLNNFLQPEVDRICKEVGLRDSPNLNFRKFDLKDESILQRIYARFAEMGIMTPDETFRALNDGILPEKSDAFENQKEFKKQRDQKLFTPLAPEKEPSATSGVNGRPSGTKSKQTTKKVSPIGTKASIDEDGEEEEIYLSISKFHKNISELDILEKNLKKEWKRIKGSLTKNQKGVLDTLKKYILINEPIENWQTCAAKYIESPEFPTVEKSAFTDNLMDHFNCSEELALVLQHSLYEGVEKIENE